VVVGVGGATVVVVVVGVGGATVVVVVVGVGGATVVVVVVGVGGATVVVVVVGVGGATVVVVVVVGGPDGPQNWTLEMAGVFPTPTFGNPAFEKCPDICDGDNDVTTAPGPPLTMMNDIGVVDCQLPPVLEPFETCTTPALTSGPSNTYFPLENSNFATRVLPDGQFSFPPCDTVVCTKPATTKTAPKMSNNTPAYHGRRLRNERVAVDMARSSERRDLRRAPTILRAASPQRHRGSAVPERAKTRGSDPHRRAYLHRTASNVVRITTGVGVGGLGPPAYCL
jgi:hypothetical protein